MQQVTRFRCRGDSREGTKISRDRATLRAYDHVPLPATNLLSTYINQSADVIVVRQFAQSCATGRAVPSTSALRHGLKVGDGRLSERQGDGEFRSVIFARAFGTNRASVH